MGLMPVEALRRRGASPAASSPSGTISSSVVAVRQLINVVQGSGIFEYDFSRYILRHIGKVTLDHLARLRPGRVRMRKIRGPHIVGRSEQLMRCRADRIVLERREELPPNVIARLERQRVA